jgi:hypothetical protein
MKTESAIFAIAVAGILCVPPAGEAQTPTGQSFVASASPAGLAADPTLIDAPDSTLFAEGTRAINESRWSDAVKIFTQVAGQNGAHADGALYWKAYAENKQGQSAQALSSCGQLRQAHAGSSWIDECGALEIEIRAKSGHPVQPSAQQDDDLKLLALSTLMQRDEKSALAEIDQILNSDASEKLKQGALFIMGEHHSDTIYPQIVRISYVDGDVRVTRRTKNPHGKDAVWEKATAGLPLETGYNLVTGEGRAEIEFENASTLYLAENSVLTLNDLHTAAGIPHTEVALLSGTVTMHIHPYVAGEVFMIRTPTDTMTTRYPHASNVRISSYTDGIALTPLGGGTVGLSDSNSQPLTPGQTLYFKDSRRIIDAGPIHPPDFSAWDQWVRTRYAARAAAESEALKASGLSSPIPGLADMQGKGTFFPCEPYGTCWRPPSPASQETAETVLPQSGTQVTAQTAPGTSASQPARNIGFIGKPMPNASPAGFEDMFPCVPDEVRYMMARGPYAGNAQAVYAPAQFRQDPWMWAVCNSGSWIYGQNRYLWVAGRRHHHPPVHWVKFGNSVAFVPVHPRDVKDRLPVNRKSPVFVVDTRGTHPVEKIEFKPTEKAELLNEPPKGLHSGFEYPLARAEEPRIEAHAIKDDLTARNGPATTHGIPITFDHKSQTFMMPVQKVRGSRTVTVVAPINNHSGNLQSHAGGVSGGSRGGGSLSSAGGGSHSSAGSAPSSTSSNASSASSSASSSVGSAPHH